MERWWSTFAKPRFSYGRVDSFSIASLGLNLYHCFSQVKDALSELDKYTQGYVDNYLFDGKAMNKEAKRIQSKMATEKKNKNF